MMPRHKRLLMVLGIVGGVALAAFLALSAFRDNVMLYYDPTDLAAALPRETERFRLGGMVEKGSLKKTEGTLDVQFFVTDYKHTVAVKYSGILPDLFREGQGVVAHGRMQGNVFVADEILALHPGPFERLEEMP